MAPQTKRKRRLAAVGSLAPGARPGAYSTQPGSYSAQAATGVMAPGPARPAAQPNSFQKPPARPVGTPGAGVAGGPKAGTGATAQNISTLTPQSFGSYNPAAGQPDPRDATYFANVAKLLATSQQDYSGTQLEQSQADVNYNTELGTRGTQRTQDIRNLAESMIGSGLLRSGTHNRRATEATGHYLEGINALQTGKSQDDAKRQATLAAILSNLGIDEQGLYAEAAQRYAEKQANAAANANPIAPVSYGSATGGAAGTGSLGKGVSGVLTAANPANYNVPRKPPKRKRK